MVEKSAVEVPLEKHYTIPAISKQLSISDDTARERFRNEPGVIHLTKTNRRRRKYETLLVPESVLLRVYARLRGGAK
jgi:hypothetical protein